MLDAKLIRNNPDYIRNGMLKRKDETNLDSFLSLDEKRREYIVQVENLKSSKNSVSQEISLLKTQNQETAHLIVKMREVSEVIKDYDMKLRVIEEEMDALLLRMPNTPDDDVPIGDTEDSNVEVRRWGNPIKFDYLPKAHWEIGESLGILDFTTASKVTGSRFAFYRGLGARLERSLINFMLDLHTMQHGYSEVFPPFVVHRRSMTGTGQLPKFEEDAFKLADTDYFLVPTAEVPVTNMYRDLILDADILPIKHAAYSACFRAEAGAAGRDTRGLIRNHQFNKVEIVKFTRPEDSSEELEKLVNDAEQVLKLLELPYRVVLVCVGDLGFAAAKKYDIEVWMPSYNRYVEISSCSNFRDFQARRANIKYRPSAREKAEFLHTLNGSGLAVGRTFAAILENYQQKDGSVVLPKKLIQYMGGIEKI